MPENTPIYTHVDPMTVGQFKALEVDTLKHVPTDLPKGFAQFLVDTGKIGPAIDAVVSREFSSWAFANSWLQSLTMSWRNVPASQAGTIGQWILAHQYSCTYEQDALTLGAARFLVSERHFAGSDRIQPCFYRVAEKAPDMRRLVVCFGGKQKLRNAAVNPLQVLQYASHPGDGWWPRFEATRRQQQLIFVGMIGENEFVFMQMEWHAQSSKWSIKECIVNEDQVFQPNQILVFSKSVGY